MKSAFSEEHDRLTEEALDRFYPAYGRAMLNWSNLEDALCDWFHHLSGMKPAPARAVFYSARSFAGRADMLDAVLSTPNSKRAVVEFVRAVLKKSLSYNSTRNRIAHQVPVVNATDPENHVAELYEGGAYPFLGGKPILAEHLLITAENYRKLVMINRGAWLLIRDNRSPKERKAKLAEYLERVLQLPNEADSSELSRKQLGRALQRKPSRP